MNYQLFRLIFKQIALLDKQEPVIATHIKQAIKEHVDIYRKTKQLVSNKIKKQQDYELPQQFIKFLEVANSGNTYTSYRCKLRLIEIFTSVNIFLDSSGHLRKDSLSLQMKILEKNSQFQALSNDREKDFVKNIVKKVFMGEEKYQYKNLTSYFRDLRSQISITPGNQSLELLTPFHRNYVSSILNGKQTVSQEYLKAYRFLFSEDEKSNFDKVFESYLQSRYILVDFEDVSQRKTPRSK